MNILLTGGAGFIGSNLVSFFLDQPTVDFVRVMDNLATGHLSNLEEFQGNRKFEFFNGDGTITRDFTPVSNVIQMNWKGLTSGHLELGKHYVFNVACGQTTDLNSIWRILKDISGSSLEAIYGPNRQGDIFFSLADVTSAKELLGYVPDSDLKGALTEAVDYYRASLSDSPS